MNKIRIMLRRGMGLAIILCFALILLNELFIRDLIVAWFPIFSQNTLHILNLEIAYEGFILPAILFIIFLPYYIITRPVKEKAKGKVKKHNLVTEIKA